MVQTLAKEHPWWGAIVNSNRKYINQLRGAHLHSVDSYGWTGLMRACYHTGDPEVIRILYQEAGSYNANHQTALYLAIFAKRLTMPILSILKQEVHMPTISQRTKQTTFPIIEALNEQIDKDLIVELMSIDFSERPDLLEAKYTARTQGFLKCFYPQLYDDYKERFPPVNYLVVEEESPWIQACMNSDIETLRALRDSFLFSRSPFLSTALMVLAYSGGSTECMDLVLEEIGLKNKGGQTALYLSILSEHCTPAVVRTLAHELDISATNTLVSYDVYPILSALLHRLPSETLAEMISTDLTRDRFGEKYTPFTLGLLKLRHEPLYDTFASKFTCTPQVVVEDSCPWVQAAINSDMGALTQLADEYLNSRGPLGLTALMYASFLGSDISCMKFLGKELGAYDICRKTAIYYAILKKRLTPELIHFFAPELDAPIVNKDTKVEEYPIASAIFYELDQAVVDEMIEYDAARVTSSHSLLRTKYTPVVRVMLEELYPGLHSKYAVFLAELHRETPALQPRYRLAVFDLDGTLANTLGIVQGSVNAVIDAVGGQALSAQEVRDMAGKGQRALIVQALREHNLSAQELDEFYALSCKFMAEHSSDACEYPGVTRLIRNLTNSGVKCAVLTNRGSESANAILRAIFADSPEVVSMFTQVIGAGAGVLPKPDPTSLNSLMDSLDAKKSHTVFIGDTIVDYETATHAGVTSIGCTWGFGEEAHLTKCDVIARSVDDVYRIIMHGYDE